MIRRLFTSVTPSLFLIKGALAAFETREEPKVSSPRNLRLVQDTFIYCQIPGATNEFVVVEDF
jgi:hypothetical protein